SPRLERPCRIQSFVLDPHAPDTDAVGDAWYIEQRRGSFTKRYGFLGKHERHQRRVAPHVPAIQEILLRRRAALVFHQQGLAALRAHGGGAVSWLLKVAG